MPKTVRASSEEKVKKFPPGDILSSSAQSRLSSKDYGKAGELEEDDAISLLKLAKRKPISNILQVKLPLKVQGRRRGRKKRFFRLDRDDSSTVESFGGISSEKKTPIVNADSDVPQKAEKNVTTPDTDAGSLQVSISSSVEGQKPHSDSTAHLKSSMQKSEDQLSSSEALKDHEDKLFSLEHKTVEGDGLSKDSSKSMDVCTVLPVSKTAVRVPKKRGRKPGKANSAKTSIREPKILPKRERKLTEKGLELLQIIGHKKGTDCHLKEAFVSGDVIESLNLKDNSTDSLRSVPHDKQETDRSGGVPKEQLEEPDRGNMKIDEGEVLRPSEEKTDILLDDNSGRHGSLSEETMNVSRKKVERVVESDSMTEDHDMSRDDDRYSEASEGSDSLVIDVADDLTPSGDIGQKSGETRSGTAQKNRDAKSSDILHDKGVDIKPRLFPRLKYTLSHEERRGNKLAKLKKNRLKKKRRGARGKVVRESVKEVENIVSDSQKIQSLDRSQLPSSSESSVGVSPLESLTRMVTETPDAVDSSSDGKKATVLPDTHISATVEETSKPVKSSKQQRAPYKPRLKMTDNFLSMVEQDRPSQIDRPLADDLIKEKSIRGRSRHRFANRSDNQSYQESSVKKKEETPQSDLNEPLEFSTSSSSMETIDLSKTDMKSIGYPRQTMTSFVGEHNRYGPGHRGTVMGQMRLAHPSQQFDLYQAGSPQGSISPLPIVNSENLGYDKRAPSASHIAAYQGMVGLPEGRAPLLNYSAHIQPMIGSKGTSNSPDCTPTCVRMQGPGVVSQVPWESQKRLENCPCEECRSPTTRPKNVVDKETVEARQETSSSPHRVISPCQGEASNSRKNEGVLVPNTTNMDKNGTLDQEFVITDVFSLRDPNNTISRVGAPGKAVSPFDIREQNNTDNRSHGSPGTKEIFETVRETPKEVSEPAHTTGKPKEFETKKKRLDLITGKLSAQKRLSPHDDAFRGDKSEREISSPAASIKTEEASKSLSPFSKQSTVTAEQSFKPQHFGYMYPQTSFIPVMNPYYDPKSVVPPSSLDVPPARVISPESHMVPHHPVYMDPRPYYPSPEYFQPIRPVYDAEGIPPPNYQHPSPGIPYIPPDMVGHMRFHQLPGFPYYPPRFAPAPRYFSPRESLPMATPLPPPPPYSTFPMVSSPHRKYSFRSL